MAELFLKKTMQKYTIECAKQDYREESFLAVWRALLKESSSPERIYQTSEFFNFVLKTGDTQERMELLSITCCQTGDLKGIAPLRFREQSFDFSLGAKKLAAPAVEVIVLLGSTPLFPLTPGLFEEFVHDIFTRFPSCQAVSLPALPFRSDLQLYIQESEAIRAQFCVHVLHGWRDTHAIPLPGTFDEYQQQFSAKKRFNLNRQIRQLREHGGGKLRLNRIQTPEQVPALIEARNRMVAPESRAGLLSERKIAALAEHDLLLSYTLQCGEQICAVILATRSQHVLHVHNILYSSELARLSVGTSILHMAIEDLIGHFEFNALDLGYSNPSYTHQSSNAVEQRGHVLVLRKTWRNRLLCFAHDFHVRQVENLKNILEHRRRRLKQKRKAASAINREGLPTVYSKNDGSDSR